MNHRIGLAAAALGVAILIPTAPASAADSQPCVTHSEWRNMPLGTQRSVEKAWEVVGRGVKVGPHDSMPLGFRQNQEADIPTRIMQYRFCGVGPRKAAVYLFIDKRDNQWYFSSTWVAGQSPFVPSP